MLKTNTQTPFKDIAALWIKKKRNQYQGLNLYPLSQSPKESY